MSKKFTENEIIEGLNNYTYDHFHKLKNPSEKVKLVAVNKNGFYISYIKNPSEKVQLAAVNEDGEVIRFIKNPSEKVQLAAVNEDGEVIRFIKNPSDKVKLTALKQNGHSIRYINSTSKKFLLEAVKQNGESLAFIDDKHYTDELTYHALNSNFDSAGFFNDNGNDDNDVEYTIKNMERIFVKLIKNNKYTHYIDFGRSKRKTPILMGFVERGIELTRKMKLAFVETHKSLLKLTKEEHNFFLDNVSGVPKGNGFQYNKTLIIDDKRKKIIKSLKIKFGKIK